ncbi:MAG: YjbQ family protein [Anaerolineaceae bacterium]|nr:YjbQ family protein [Anaerolineaceae bacterium]
MQTFTVRTSSRQQMIDITERVVQAIRPCGASGVCQVFVPHTTAGVTINENADPDVVADLLGKLARLVPEKDGYRHAEGNSDAHLKASLMGSSVWVPVEDGRVALGAWQAVYFCEFDGPRSRKVHLQMLSK